MFKRAQEINIAFGNPEGDSAVLDWSRLEKHIRNILDEYQGTMVGVSERDVDQVRDGLCDIMVFALGAYHFMGANADDDMQAVLDGVMTRFCKTEEDLAATMQKYAALGVDFYVEGKFPTKCLKSAKDQKDKNGDNLPMGKFLKSASYRQPVFAPLQAPKHAAELSECMGSSKPTPCAPFTAAEALLKPAAWFNGCDRTVPEALRYLADNDRPRGGEDRFNSIHLLQLADEIERVACTKLTFQPAIKLEPTVGAATDYTTIGAALSAIQQSISIIDSVDRGAEVIALDAIRRVLRGAVIVSEDAEPVAQR